MFEKNDGAVNCFDCPTPDLTTSTITMPESSPLWRWWVSLSAFALGYFVAQYASSQEPLLRECPKPAPSPPGSCPAQLEKMTATAAAYRTSWGELSCETRGIGPTGGFCLTAEMVAVGGNEAIDPVVAAAFGQLMSRASVLNLGAGLGQYERFWEGVGDPAARPASYAACDGAENLSKYAYRRGDGTPYVTWCDLTGEISFPPADWVMSIEVAEHIPPQMEATFLRQIVSHARKGVLISWAFEGQRGHHHVNGKNSDAVIAVFKAAGWGFDEEATAKLRGVVDGGAAAPTPWLKNTIYVFRPEK